MAIQRSLRLAVAALAFLPAVSSAQLGVRPSRFPLAPRVTPSAPTTERPATWGTAYTQLLRIPASAFLPTYEDGATKWSYYGMGRWQMDGYGDYAAPLYLPSGAIILGIELNGVDLNLNGDLSALLIIGNKTDAEGLNYGGPYTSNAPGQTTVYEDYTSDHLVVDNSNNIYDVDVGFGADATSLRLASVGVFYRLQMSPAPGTATFGDVPTNHPFFRAIEALAASGITGGCGGGNFCPDRAVTRGELAKFLSNALGLYWQ